MYVCLYASSYICMYPESPEDSFDFPGAKAIGTLELPIVVLGNKLQQCVLFTDKSCMADGHTSL